MRKKPSHDKQRIINQGSDNASNIGAIMTIVDDNENNASNDNTNEGNINFNFVIYF